MPSSCMAAIFHTKIRDSTTEFVHFCQHLRHAVVRHVLDAGRRQLVEHLGMLRPHAVVAIQQRVYERS